MTRLTSLLCALVCALTTSAAAQVLPENAISARILPGWVQSDGSQMAAVELRLAAGWKTYWRSPGDAGIPPRFDWRGARNLGGVHVHWPTPTVFWQSGMRSVGYNERVVLPLTVQRKSDGRDVRLKGRMELGICSDICVPMTLDLDGTLPATATERSAPITAALAALPYAPRDAGVRSVNCRIEPSADGVYVTATLDMPRLGPDEEAVIETPRADIWVSDAKTTRSGDTLSIRAEMVSFSDTPLAVSRSGLTITVIGRAHSVEISGCAP